MVSIGEPSPFLHEPETELANVCRRLTYTNDDVIYDTVTRDRIPDNINACGREREKLFLYGTSSDMPLSTLRATDIHSAQPPGTGTPFPKPRLSLSAW